MSALRSRWAGYAGSVAAVIVASLGAEVADRLLGIVNISLLYLIVVVAVAILWGLGPALTASLLGAAALDLLFVPPFGTLSVQNAGDWLTLLFFLVIAVLTGRLAAGARARAEEARQRERATAVLYDLSTALIAEGDLAVILPRIAQRVAGTFALDSCHILLPSADRRLNVVAAFGPWPDMAERGAQAIVQQVLQEGNATRVYEPAPRVVRHHALAQAVRRPSGASWTVLYLPLTVTGTVVGVMRVARSGGGEPFGEEAERLLTTFAHQAALAIDKMHLIERARHAAALEEADRVKTALLSSVSHDLRSPLAAIKTAVTGLLDPGEELQTEGRAELLLAIDEETDRLTRLVADLLDLSRIQGGALQPRTEWVDLAEIVATVIDRLSARLPDHPLETVVQADLPLLPLDFVRIDQVLSNLIENAAAYSPAGSPITITAGLEYGGVTVRVRDRGPGIPLSEREQIFEPFYRLPAAERARSGSGLGLAISRGIISAHGGWIRAEVTEPPGASIVFWLPMAQAPQAAPRAPLQAARS